MSKKQYGSGYFGEWVEDQYGLPAYSSPNSPLKFELTK